MKNLLKYSTVASAIMALAGSAYALPSLVLSDNLGDSVTISGSGSITTAGSVSTISFNVINSGGEINFNGNIGAWNVDVSTGEGNPPGPFPIGGTATHPVLDLSTGSDNFSGGAGNILHITYTDDNAPTGLGPTVGSILTAGGGTQSPGWKNTLATFVNGVQVGTGSSTVSPWGISYSSPINSLNYSLGIEDTITASGPGSFSGDDSVSTVPDGGLTVAFLGAALTGIAALRRKLGC